MAIRGRPAKPHDIRKCVEIVTAHSVLRSRYAEILSDLSPVMLSLLGREALVRWMRAREYELKIALFCTGCREPAELRARGAEICRRSSEGK